MKVGFDISQTGPEKAGCGYLTDSLIRNMEKVDRQNNYLLYPTFGDFFWDNHWSADTFQPTAPNFKRHRGHVSFDDAQAFWKSPPLNLETWLGNPDIVHANNYFCPDGIQNARLVYTLYDLSFVEAPEWTTEANRLGCFAGVFRASLYADMILAISDYTRHHFLETFPHYPPERVKTIYVASRFNNVSIGEQPKRLGTLQARKFWLTVGTIEPRKNHIRLLRAYAALKQDVGGTYPLAIAGGKGWLMETFKQEIELLGLQDDVIYLGYVDDSELTWLYSNCFACVYPSLFEGFGLPVLEAMSLGAPVITSNVSSIPEIVGEQALLIDPLDEHDITRVMKQMVSGEIDRDHYKRSLVERAHSFSWEKTTQEVLKLYDDVLTLPPYQTSEAKQYVFTRPTPSNSIETTEKYSRRSAQALYWLRKARAAYYAHRYITLLVYGAAGIAIAPELLRNKKVKRRLKQIFQRNYNNR